ncbi:MAG: hypothetical protein FJ161_03325 [Gammaproteobacteria bacterium]|nr:hypothetical protein [Gammaproteobacteria bacterium]
MRHLECADQSHIFGGKKYLYKTKILENDDYQSESAAQFKRYMMSDRSVYYINLDDASVWYSSTPYAAVERYFHPFWKGKVIWKAGVLVGFIGLGSIFDIACRS